MASALLFYIAKTLGISAVLWIYYVWFLRDERFHQYNRFYLLGVYALSLGLPLIPWRWWVIEAPANLINNTGVWRPTGAEYTTPSADQWVISAALGVSTMLLLLLIYRVVHVLLLERKYPKRQVQQAMIVETDLENAPFSFWNRLFWKSSLDLTQGPGRKYLNTNTPILFKNTPWIDWFLSCYALCFGSIPFTGSSPKNWKPYTNLLPINPQWGQMPQRPWRRCF